MREIHHRVKNNLQIISSLLSMQQRALTDPAARAAVGDTRQRISALALIYRTLYQSPDIREADLADFLRELTGQLVASRIRTRSGRLQPGHGGLPDHRPGPSCAVGPVGGRGHIQRPEARFLRTWRHAPCAVHG